MMNYIDVKNKIKNKLLDIYYNTSKDIYYKIKTNFDNAKDDTERNFWGEFKNKISLQKKGKVLLSDDPGILTIFLKRGLKISLNYPLENVLFVAIKEVYDELKFPKIMLKNPLKHNTEPSLLPPVLYFDEIDNDIISIDFLAYDVEFEKKTQIFFVEPSIDVRKLENVILDKIKDVIMNEREPLIVGIGIGGSADYSVVLSKRALTRDLDFSNSNPQYAELEKRLTNELNSVFESNIFLGSRIFYYPTHKDILAISISVVPWNMRKGTVNITLF